MSEIGRNIRTIRNSLDISETELAKKAGYKSQNAIVAIENGSIEPAYEKVKDIANALGVSIYQVKGSNKFREVTGKGIYYKESDLIALDLFSPIIDACDSEDIDRTLDYMLMLLKAKNRTPVWKKPKYIKENAE